MPIIIDNFHVRLKAPIDNRFVVGGSDSFYQNKDDIENKYLGLRIWDLNIPGGPFCWKGDIEGWVSENAIGVTVDGSTSPGYLPVFTSGPTVLGNSLLYQTSNQIGIGILPSSINPNTQVNGSAIDFVSNGLHVAGNIKTDNFLIGKGDYITQLNAGNVVGPGLLDIRYIDNRQSGGIGLSVVGGPYVLLNTGLSNGVNWVAANTLTVANANLASNISIVDDNISPSINYITFALGIGNQQLKINSSKMGFLPSSGQLFLSNGSAGAPVYSFLNSTSTGIYYDGYNINFSISGANRVSISPGVITIYDSNYAQIDFYKSPTDVQKLFVGQGSILKYRTNSWDPNDAVQVASDNIVWHSGNLYTLRDSGNLPLETGRSINSISTDANGNQIQGVYTYNVYNTAIAPSSQIHWSVLSFGRGVNGSVQLASNWFSGINTTSPGTVYAERDILLRSLRDTGESWSPWVKIWNSGNSGYVPFGAIMMWSGSATLLPTGWRLCDGSPAVTIPAGSVPGQPSMTSIIIPDLRERFVVGAGIQQSKLVFNYGNNFTLYIPTVTTPGTYTFNVDITTPYYIDTTGRLRSGVNTDGFRYHLYKGTTTPSMSGFVYMVYDNRYGSYEVIQGAFPAVNALVTGTVKWMGTSKGGTSYYKTDPNYPLNNATYVSYDKYFSLGRRVAFTEIVWPTIQSSGYNPGDKGGFDTIILEGSQMVKHQHDSTSGENYAANATYGYVGLQNNPGARDSDNYHYLTSAYGNNQPIENRPPYYALAFIIYIGI